MSIANFELINDDFSHNPSATLPFIQLLLINCLMSYLEHSTVQLSTMFKSLCIGRKLIILRQRLEVLDDQN